MERWELNGVSEIQQENVERAWGREQERGWMGEKRVEKCEVKMGKRRGEERSGVWCSVNRWGSVG